MPQNTKSQPAEDTGNSAPDSASERAIAAGKGRPTPTRKEKEEARKRPLVVTDRNEARKRAREQAQLERDKFRVGYASGVEKYLPARDRGEQRRYIRDYVDARTSIGEFMLPVLGVVVILSFVSDLFPAIQLASILLLWAFLIIAIVDVLILGRIVRKKLAAKFGESRVETGIRWYAGMRALQWRAMRMPKPQVKRRQYPS